jgi:inner membrane protein
MEPITQALLGATTAELVAGQRLRGRAMGWGAIIGMSPDLDVLLAPLHDGYGEWLYHRGTTHSLWFGFVVGPLLGWILWRWRDQGREHLLRAWIGLATAALVTHPLLDGFTPYGTQLFAPFWRERFAWNGVAIVDPLYSIILVLGVAGIASRRRAEAAKKRALILSLVLSTSYLLAGFLVNRWVENDLRRVLAETAPDITRIRAYPTIFQPWLRSLVVRTPNTVYVGLHSWWDWGCPSWRVHPWPTQDPGLAALRSTWQAELLEWFADGDIGIFVSPTASGRRIRIEDLRYSWSSPKGRGMWGVQAIVDETNQIVGPIERLDRISIEAPDLDHLGRILAGQLPGATEGWTRPSSCVDAAR